VAEKACRDLAKNIIFGLDISRKSRQVLKGYICCLFMHVNYTDKKENEIFLIYKEIQNGAVAKSYMTNGLLIYG
jgi:hypothetical protein